MIGIKVIGLLDSTVALIKNKRVSFVSPSKVDVKEQECAFKLS